MEVEQRLYFQETEDQVVVKDFGIRQMTQFTMDQGLLDKDSEEEEEMEITTLPGVWVVEEVLDKLVSVPHQVVPLQEMGEMD